MEGIGRKPYDARALIVVTIWQEIEGKSERAYTVGIERDKKRLRMLGLEHAPHRTALYRTGKRLSEEYMRLLNQKILERLEPAKKVGADATGLRQSGRDCAWSSTSEGGRREYVKLHALFNLETRTVETFETTRGTQYECRHLGELRKLGGYRMLGGGWRLPIPEELQAHRREGRHAIHQTEKEQPNEGQGLLVMEKHGSPLQGASTRLQPLLRAASKS